MEAKIGMSVVYQQDEGDAPLSPFGRRHAALIGFVGASDVVHLTVFPLGQETRYVANIERGDSSLPTRCWFHPEV